MRAIKENREYTITEDVKDSFVKEGYDIIDDNGNVIAYGAGKTVPFQKYIDLVEQCAKLDAENNKLRKEITVLEAQSDGEAEAKPKKRTKKGE